MSEAGLFTGVNRGSGISAWLRDLLIVAGTLFVIFYLYQPVRVEVFVNQHFVPEPYVPTRFEDDRSQPEITLSPEEYFVLGDHRNIASDSRDFGPVPRSFIYGKAAFVYWPVDQAGIVH